MNMRQPHFTVKPLVTRRGTGGGGLEATIALYEGAVALQRRCERLLTEAELRVQQLMARQGGLVVEDVRPGDIETD